MSYEHVNYVRDHSKAKGPARFLLFDIATRTNKDGYAFPSQERLAKDTGMTVRGIRNILKDIPKDELVITPGGSEKGGERHSTQYRVLISSEAAPVEKNTSPLAQNPVSKPTPPPERYSFKTAKENIESNGNRPSAEDHPVQSAGKRVRQVKPFRPPTIEEFVTYGRTKDISEQDCHDQFEIWEAGDWNDGNGTPIQSWKQKLLTFKANGWLPSDKRARNTRPLPTKMPLANKYKSEI